MINIFFLIFIELIGRSESKKRIIKKLIRYGTEHKQDVCEKKLLYENCTAEYGSGICLDIGKEQSKKIEKGKKERTTC